MGRKSFRSGSRSGLAARRRVCVLLLCLISVALTGCDNFDFYGLLSGTGAIGPTGGLPVISPRSVTVTVNGTCIFTASGGTPPYRFTVVSGSGTIDPGTGAYTAPGAPSSDDIQVVDAVGGWDDARAAVVF
jgi:hypothetical protein